MDTKTITIYGLLIAVGVAIGLFVSSKLSCHSPATLEQFAPTVNPSVHDTTIVSTPVYLKGTPYPVAAGIDTVHDSFPMIGWRQVDTVRYTDEKIVYVTKPVPVHDTTVVHTDTRALFLATVNAEHDFLSGYGGAIELDHRLDWLGLRNYSIYASGGFTRGFTTHGEPRFAAGVKIPFWESP